MLVVLAVRCGTGKRKTLLCRKIQSLVCLFVLSIFSIFCFLKLVPPYICFVFLNSWLLTFTDVPPHFMWNDMNQNDNSFLYTWGEHTPIKDHGNLGYDLHLGGKFFISLFPVKIVPKYV